MSVNNAILIGRLGKDPAKSMTATGKTRVSFSIATDFGRGEKKQTTWHSITAWEKLAELCLEYLHRGDPVYIEGRIDNRSYTDKDGNKRYVSEVVAEKVNFLKNRNDNTEEPQTNEGNSDDPESLPF